MYQHIFKKRYVSVGLVVRVLFFDLLDDRGPNESSRQKLGCRFPAQLTSGLPGFKLVRFHFFVGR